MSTIPMTAGQDRLTSLGHSLAHHWRRIAQAIGANVTERAVAVPAGQPTRIIHADRLPPKFFDYLR